MTSKFYRPYMTVDRYERVTPSQRSPAPRCSLFSGDAQTSHDHQMKPSTTCAISLIYVFILLGTHKDTDENWHGCFIAIWYLTISFELLPLCRALIVGLKGNNSKTLTRVFQILQLEILTISYIVVFQRCR